MSVMAHHRARSHEKWRASVSLVEPASLANDHNRPGRMDDIMHVSLPTRAMTRRAYLSRKAEQKAQAERERWGAEIDILDGEVRINGVKVPHVIGLEVAAESATHLDSLGGYGYTSDPRREVTLRLLVMRDRVSGGQATW